MLHLVSSRSSMCTSHSRIINALLNNQAKGSNAYMWPDFTIKFLFFFFSFSFFFKSHAMLWSCHVSGCNDSPISLISTLIPFEIVGVSQPPSKLLVTKCQCIWCDHSCRNCLLMSSTVANELDRKCTATLFCTLLRCKNVSLHAVGHLHDSNKPSIANDRFQFQYAPIKAKCRLDEKRPLTNGIESALGNFWAGPILLYLIPMQLTLYKNWSNGEREGERERERRKMRKRRLRST